MLYRINNPDFQYDYYGPILEHANGHVLHFRTFNLNRTNILIVSIICKCSGMTITHQLK